MGRCSVLLALILAAAPVLGEPYLAVRTGQACSACHVNPTGGGLRTDYGSLYAQTQLPAKPLEKPGESFARLFDKGLRVGANARASARATDVSDRDDVAGFETDRVALYLSARLNESVTLYLDQQVAPGGSLNREAWGMFTYGDWYLKAGKLFLPFGWRLEDDAAFIRQATGINFNNPDNGVELGYRRGPWNFQAAFTNGAAGAVEINDGKQGSFRGEYIGQRWRLGVSAHHNNTDRVDRTMYGIFGGLRIGPLSWLLEWDRIEDDPADGQTLDMDVALVEANYHLRQGHNLKLTLEALAPDAEGEEDRLRSSLVWEYFPLAFTQLRAGYRDYESDGERPLDNREEVFLQLHLFF